MPNLGSPPLDESGKWRREWVLFLQAIFFRTGGSGTPVDINTLQQQDEISQDVPPQNAATMAALQGINDIWAEQLSPANLSDVRARLTDLETALQTGVDLGPVFQRLNDIEAMLADFRLPTTPVAEQWNAPTLLNSWVYWGTPYNPPGYYKDVNGTVHLRGMVKLGTINTAIFTLPVGYRPVNQEIFPAISNDAFGGCVVNTSGSVIAYLGNNAYFSIDGITFRAA
jgi:hypothetical protein